MQTYAILEWVLWLSVILTGVLCVVAVVKLKFSEKFLPQWHELGELEAILPVRREEARQATETIDKCRGEIGKLEGTVGGLRILKEWQDANPEAPARIQQMMTDLERYKAELSALQQKLAQEEQRLNKVFQDANQLDNEKKELTITVGSLKESIAELQKKEKLLVDQVHELDGQEHVLKRQVNELLEKQYAAEKKLEITLDELEQGKKEKRNVEADRDKALADRNAALAEKAGVEKAIEQLKNLANGMQANLKDAGVTGGGNYQDLSKGISFPPLQPTKSPATEQQSVERAQRYISGKKLVFSERIVHAFHTSLKIGDISPLVVLAGISGTGKSELPRHYADGMGFHFLLSAVQPRWDSPQDLFGFYNYLERRYKATELARALVQFERFNQKSFEEVFEDTQIDNRSDRMLMVLLLRLA